MRTTRLSIESLESRRVFAGFTFQIADELDLITDFTEGQIQNSANYALAKISRHVAWQGTLDVVVRVRPAAENPYPSIDGIMPSVISLSWLNDHWSNDTLYEMLTGVDRQPQSPDAGMTIYLGQDGQIRNYGLPVWFDSNPQDYVPANVPTGTFDYIGVLCHEIFHGIGFVAASKEFRDLTSTIDGTDYFIGNRTQQVFGGPLPLAPRSGGLLQDHYGNTSLPSNTLGSGLMFQWGNYEGNRLDIGKLDLAVLEDLGLTITNQAGLPLVDRIDSQLARNTLSNLSISENVAIGTEVGTLSTTDGSLASIYALAEGGPDNNIFQIVGNSLRTNSAIDYESNTSFSILVRRSDAQGIWTATPFTIAVNNLMERPVARDDSFTVNIAQTTLLDVAVNDDDFDATGALNNLELTSLPSLGTVQIKQGKVEYLPNRTSIGSDSFSYRIRSANGDLSNVAQVAVRLEEWPIANADVGHTRRNASLVIDVLANDTFIISPLIASSLRIEGQLPGGQATIEDGKIRFSPSAELKGQTTFWYSVQNSLGNRSSASAVTITEDGSFYQNPNNPWDVTGDTTVTPLDALVVINELNRKGASALELGRSTPPYYDVNADYQLSPLDALMVINYLNLAGFNSEGSSHSEGESESIGNRLSRIVGEDDFEKNSVENETMIVDSLFVDSSWYSDSTNTIALLQNLTEELLRRRRT